MFFATAHICRQDWNIVDSLPALTGLGTYHTLQMLNCCKGYLLSWFNGFISPTSSSSWSGRRNRTCRIQTLQKKKQPTNLYYVCFVPCIMRLESEAHCFQIGKFSLQLQNETAVKNQCCTNADVNLVMLQGVIQLSGHTKTWSRRTQFWSAAWQEHIMPLKKLWLNLRPQTKERSRWNEQFANSCIRLTTSLRELESTWIQER